MPWPVFLLSGALSVPQLSLDDSQLWLLGGHRPAQASPEWTPPVVHTLALLTTVRLAEAVIWPEPFAETDSGVIADRYRDAFTHAPEHDFDRSAFSWDGDKWEINVIGHGLMGSEIYLRARQCRFGWAGSLAFVTASAALWEYGFEANGVRPSAQDLVITPIAGLLFGEARYQLWRAASGVRQPTFRMLMQSVADPFGELERGVGLFDC